jgi:hemin uptake protein HemP
MLTLPHSSQAPQPQHAHLALAEAPMKSPNMAPPTPSKSQPQSQSHLQSLALQSQQLLQGQKKVQIVHHDQVYVLQATRQGKLILTK